MATAAGNKGWRHDGRFDSCISFSSAVTLTPESGAGGRPSHASELLSPRSQSSCGDTALHASRWVHRHIPGELRRRRYFVPCGAASPVGTTADVPAKGSAETAYSPSSARSPQCRGDVATLSAPGCQGPWPKPSAGCEAPRPFPQREDSERLEDVLVAGPLQQRRLLLFWGWRWFVLDPRELRIYEDEQAFRRLPEMPLERHNVADLSVAQDPKSPWMLALARSHGARPIDLRAGPGSRWEEIATAALWLRALASVCNSTGELPEPLSPRGWRRRAPGR